MRVPLSRVTDPSQRPVWPLRPLAPLYEGFRYLCSSGGLDSQRVGCQTSTRAMSRSRFTSLLFSCLPVCDMPRALRDTLSHGCGAVGTAATAAFLSGGSRFRTTAGSTVWGSALTAAAAAEVAARGRNVPGGLRLPSEGMQQLRCPLCRATLVIPSTVANFRCPCGVHFRRVVPVRVCRNLLLLILFLRRNYFPVLFRLACFIQCMRGILVCMGMYGCDGG